ncbi:MAG: UDP-N-acetylmuramoyl-L-alanine--D-glutamate ligase [Patescibacteria group bacterium]
MEVVDFSGKIVGLLGAGRDNLAILPHLRQWGAKRIVILDKVASDKLPADIETRSGPDYLNDLAEFDLLLRSPGLPLATVKDAVARSGRSVEISSAIDVFVHLAIAKKATVIGVTGSKGKGTTATMLGAMLTASGRSNEVVGNIGRGVFDIFGKLHSDQTVVIELSSFQAEDMTASPQLAIILPIFPEHLAPLSATNPNFHSDLAAYTAAKSNICRFQTKRDERLDAVIYAADNIPATEAAKASSAYQVPLSTADSSADSSVDWHLAANGQVFLDRRMIVDLSSCGLVGAHLRLDGALAAAAAWRLGLDEEAIIGGLKNWRPLPHRMEQVAVKNGVTFIDDSYATCPEATISALTTTDRPIVLIAGGSDKGAEFNQLAEAIQKSSVKAVVTIGSQGPMIARELRQINYSGQIVTGASTMAEIVAQAKRLAQANDLILLSPAAASLDMFRNAADRGDQFQAAVADD